MSRKTNSPKSPARGNASRMGGPDGGIEFRVDLTEAEFEIQFDDAVLRQNPDHIDVLRRLGQILTQQGHYLRGLEVDQRLDALRPTDPVAYYNLACSLSLTGRVREAMASLKRAVELGYHDFAHMEVDDDLENLHGDAEFQALLEGRAGAQQGHP